MGSTEQNRIIYRFAAFEVDPDAGEVRKSGIRIRVQEQPLKLLGALLERPGSVITREELHRRLWPQDTFVDFEHGLNAAATRLRQALGDSAQTPRFIESVPRRGYRFIAHVERIAHETAKSVEPRSPAIAATGEDVSTGSPPEIIGSRSTAQDSSSPLHKRRFGPLGWFALGTGIVFITALSLVFVRTGAKPDRRVSFTLVPPENTGFAEFDSMAISPDGRLLAFTATDLSGERHLWLRPLENPRSRRLEETNGASFPFWSPDSRSIGFFIRGKLKRMDAGGGPPQTLCDARDGPVEPGLTRA